MKNIKIAVISDTHSKIKWQSEAIEELKRRGATHILHAGDFETPQALHELSQSGLPYGAVFGNNDYALKELVSKYRIKNEPYYLKIDEIKIKLMHLPYYMTPDTDIVIYGHLHRFEVTMKGNTLFLNPGEICARESGQIHSALIEVENDRYIVRHLYRDIDKNEWKETKYTYINQYLG